KVLLKFLFSLCRRRERQALEVASDAAALIDEHQPGAVSELLAGFLLLVGGFLNADFEALFEKSVDLLFGAGQKEPAFLVGLEMAGVVAQAGGIVALGIDGEGDETEIVPLREVQLLLKPGHRGRDLRTGAG